MLLLFLLFLTIFLQALSMDFPLTSKTNFSSCTFCSIVNHLIIIDSSIAHHKYAFLDIVMPLIAFVITIIRVIVANIAILMGVIITKCLPSQCHDHVAVVISALITFKYTWLCIVDVLVSIL